VASRCHRHSFACSSFSSPWVFTTTSVTVSFGHAVQCQHRNNDVLRYYHRHTDNYCCRPIIFPSIEKYSVSATRKFPATTHGKSSTPGCIQQFFCSHAAGRSVCTDGHSPFSNC